MLPIYAIAPLYVLLYAQILETCKLEVAKHTKQHV